MPKFTLGETFQDEMTPRTEHVEESVVEGKTENPETSMTSQIESEYVNDIDVTIADPKTPLVILFGPYACGKTMTLIRLTRFLYEGNYEVKAVPSFRDSKYYEKLCDNFSRMIDNEKKADSTGHINFMLVKVLKRDGTIKKPICQLLEAPGEHYFDPKHPDDDFRTYFQKIISSKNRRIWLIMLEPQSTMDDKMRMQDVRKKYVDKIKKLMQKPETKKDKVIFIFNKADKADGTIDVNDIEQLRNYVKGLYPGIFDYFEYKAPLSSKTKYKCDLIAFKTGTFTTSSSGLDNFVESSADYPEALWNKIIKRIKG